MFFDIIYDFYYLVLYIFLNQLIFFNQATSFTSPINTKAQTKLNNIGNTTPFLFNSLAQPSKVFDDQLRLTWKATSFLSMARRDVLTFKFDTPEQVHSLISVRSV